MLRAIGCCHEVHGVLLNNGFDGGILPQPLCCLERHRVPAAFAHSVLQGTSTKKHQAKVHEGQNQRQGRKYRENALDDDGTRRPTPAGGADRDYWPRSTCLSVVTGTLCFCHHSEISLNSRLRIRGSP